MPNPLELPKMPTTQPLLFDEAELPIPDRRTDVSLSKEAPVAKEIDVETASHSELVARLPDLKKPQLVLGYKKWVDKDPIARSLSEEEMRRGIQDPSAELDRLAAIDRAQDEEDRNAPHYLGRR